MARSLAWETGPRNITVNVVAPGLIDTAMSHGCAHDRRAHSPLHHPLLGRAGETADVAAAVRYLAGESGRFVTGAVLRSAAAWARRPSPHRTPRPRPGHSTTEEKTPWTP
ncbi:SDR family oxidoreductase [Streptomyces sp. KL116D]|uniref:SDR family oxidoreductase n=1 Tax=Streptomyces sp. KL116D TaxID=3045152 RepID=UPI0035591F07